jgi:seryl-tRNA synthetase
MKKENIVTKSFPTAEEIRDSLSKELDDFVNSLPATAKQKSLADDLIKLTALSDSEKTKLTEVDAKLTEIQLQIESAAVEDLPVLSKQKVKINASKAESVTILESLSERKASIEEELSKIKESLKPQISVFLRGKRDSLQTEVSIIFTYNISNGKK